MTEPAAVLLEPREVPLGGVRALTVRRTLPHRAVRTIGPWCFVDHYGPTTVAPDGSGGMHVPPHPHTGLQTVTWLLEGRVVHDDSLGSHREIRPGTLNLMTAGRGIAHAERSTAGASAGLHGVQLWVALPDSARQQTPHFEHHADLPSGRAGDATVTVVMGEFEGARSNAATYSPLVAAQIALAGSGRGSFRLDPHFEHGVISLDSPVVVDGRVLERGPLLGLGRGHTGLVLATMDARPARLLIIGGTPFEEPLVMWWNFVARDHDEIVRARADWANGRVFGTVDRAGTALPAPALPTTRLLPRPSGGLPPEG